MRSFSSRKLRGVRVGLALAIVSREYFWPYPTSFVPSGAKTSSFQCSGVPSERVKVLEEYAFAPLFGARGACCLLGTTLPARALVDRKQRIADLMSEALNVPREDVEIGSIMPLKQMVLLRPQDKWQCPRVSRKDGRLVATCLLPVYLREDVYDADELRALGEIFTDSFVAFVGEDIAGQGDAATPVEEEDGEAAEDNSALFEALRDECGISHVEMEPLDESGYTLQQFLGKEISEESAEKIAERWDERMEAMRLTNETAEHRNGSQQHQIPEQRANNAVNAS